MATHYSQILILGRIEYLGCRLLRSTIPASITLIVTEAECAKAAGRIDVMLGVQTPADLRHTMLNGSPTLPQDEGRGFDGKLLWSKL